METSLSVLIEDLSVSAKKYENEYNDDEMLTFAISFCQRLISTYWQINISDTKYSITPYNSELYGYLKGQPIIIADQIAQLLSAMPNKDAGFFIGNIYTSLLPKNVRSKNGAYYTPPILVQRLLTSIDNYRFDWINSKILDPSCGGAAFLTSISRFIIEKYKHELSADDLFSFIEKNIQGYEIDPFAAWISQTLLEFELYDLYLKVNKRIKKIISVTNSLEENYDKNFDLIIGNPPYGKVTIEKNLREKFSNSVYGHANLYGLFTDLALNLLNENGYIAYVTPTSFLGGNYFKNLRKLLGENSPLVSIDFIKDRSGVFSDVLQETALAIYKKSKFVKKVEISELSTTKNLDSLSIIKIGSLLVNQNTEKPWLIPREKDQLSLYKNISSFEYTLRDYGFKVRTGQLVWNRHKEQLSSSKRNSYPLIWAESILRNGNFEFKYTKKNHFPYFKLERKQNYLLTNKECIILQRTTSKEQSRRLISSILPNEFISQYGGVVIENHINIIEQNEETVLDLVTLNILLNSIAIDRIFRCINGSVAVSAYELNSIPFPSPEKILNLKKFLIKNDKRSSIEEYILDIYGGNIDESTSYSSIDTRQTG